MVLLKVLTDSCLEDKLDLTQFLQDLASEQSLPQHEWALEFCCSPPSLPISILLLNCGFTA